MDVGNEKYLYESEKTDFPNINKSGRGSKLSPDTEDETFHNLRD